MKLSRQVGECLLFVKWEIFKDFKVRNALGHSCIHLEKIETS
jgi:hypothetical protein